MAGKKNTKQQARKKRKQQHRQARLRREKAQRSKSRSVADIAPDDDVITDMQPFLQRATGSPGINMMEQLMATLLDSYELAGEPELADIVIDPRLCIDTFAEVGQEMGIDPEQAKAAPDDQREEIQMQMLEESTRRLVTDDVQQNILAGLNALRLRLKRAGQRDETARVAALQSFLSGAESQELWPMMGVAQAIVQKSLTVGFTLLEASMDMLEADTSKEDGLSLLERIGQSTSTQQLGALLNSTPGMQAYMQKQVDQQWAEGVAALYNGELYLELFTHEELQAAADLFAEVLGYDSETSTRQEITEDTKSGVGQALITRAETYITEMFTPERLAQLRDRLATLVNERVLEGKWLAFVYMLREDMKADNALEDQKGFLMRALFGEIRTLGDAPAEDDA